MQNSTNQQYPNGYYVPQVPSQNVSHHTSLAQSQPQSYTHTANNEYTSDMSGLHMEKSPDTNNDYIMNNVF